MLFAGAADFEHGVVERVRGAAAAVRPIDAVMSALTEGGTALTEFGEPARHRQRIVESSTELRERELIKLAALTSAIAAALRERGVEGLSAMLVAQVGVAAFSTAFQEWTEEPRPRPFPEIMAEALTRLRAEVGRARAPAGYPL